jgi:hypothetical protein
MRLPSTSVGLLVSCAVLAHAALAADVRVVPAKVEFRDTFARRQLLVSSDGHDATRQAQYVSGKPEIVSVDATGYLVPQRDG